LEKPFSRVSPRRPSQEAAAEQKNRDDLIPDLIRQFVEKAAENRVENRA
jgi:hypothetical protein